MKTKELMIGDLVRVAKDVSFKKGTVVMVRGTDGDNNFFAKNLSGSASCVDINDVDGIIKGVWCEFLEPIPLTKEILEKNGFVFNLRWHDAALEIDNFQISIQLGYANKIEYIKIIELGKDNVVPSEKTRLYLPMVKYVHKFQQAMRLCGITKSIEI